MCAREINQNNTPSCSLTSSKIEDVMKYRSRTDITAQILEAANGGSTKTKIMYKSFLSFAQLKEYLSMLVQNNLIQFDETTQMYKTTDKGYKFLGIYNQMSEFVAPEPEKRPITRV
jgi:predicted transcriptional regulator